MALIGVDRDTYSKSDKLPAGLGYSRRVKGGTFGDALPTKILIHTTSNARPTQAHKEAEFLRDSYTVSADYLVHAGGVYRILNPRYYVSWAAGRAIPGWGNGHVINIECHVSQRQLFPEKLKQLLALLCLDICAVYPIGDVRTHIRTHRAIAIPFGRKSDPEGWTNTDFAMWRNALHHERLRLKAFAEVPHAA